MSPELQLLLTEIHEDIRGIDARTRSIEQQLAGTDGAAAAKGRVREALRWIVTLVISGVGVAAGHFIPAHH